MTNTPIEERIRLLLELAANTPYPHEAETAQKQAEKLMVKHGIEVMLDGKSTKAGMKEDHLMFNGVYGEAALVSIYQIVAAFPGVAGYKEGNTPRGTYKMVVVGKDSAVKQVMSLIESLRQQHDHALLVWKKQETTVAYLAQTQTRHEYKKTLKGFTMGFYNTVAHRIKALYEEESKGNELVLATKEEEIFQWLSEEKGLALQPAKKSNNNYSNYSLGSGQLAGRKASISQNQAVSASAR